MFRRFLFDRSGNFAIFTGIALLPMILGVGAVIDGTRWYAAHADLQNAADLASLAVAASPEQDPAKLRENAQRFLTSNLRNQEIANAEVASLEASSELIKLRVTGSVPTTFMTIANVQTMTTSAYVEARRAPVTFLELALVLDNTDSMKTIMPGGQERMAVLKAAAGDLVKALLPNPEGAISIALVPYAANVNVGLANRNASWLKNTDDYSELKKGWCTTKKEEVSCAAYSPSMPCTRYSDGVPYQTICKPVCLSYIKVPIDPVTTCYADRTYNYRWLGCIGSRGTRDHRLHDRNAAVPYTGLPQREPDRQCMSEIIELTDDRDKLTNAIDAMAYANGSYKPQTYIPAGLIWGQNALSPNAPFTTAKPYDIENKNPRKVLVLMTDGDNTMKLHADSGRHLNIVEDNSNISAKRKDPEAVRKTNADSQAICDYVKSNKIEIFTVAFMVTDEDARTLLQDCASDRSKFFDATDSAALMDAFSGIARSVNQVRLAR